MLLEVTVVPEVTPEDWLEEPIVEDVSLLLAVVVVPEVIVDD